MKPTSFLGLLGLATVATGAGHQPRDYDANDYYVLEVDSHTSPDLVGERLGLRHEGEMRSLGGHHVFSTKRSPEDAVMPALQESRRKKRDLGGGDILDGVRFSERQVPRKPWEKRIPPPPLEPRAAAWRARQQPDVELAKTQKDIMKELDISDPIFNEQWHLLNTVQKGHDINVTGVWTGGITGQNATVAIVDDGLDMDSNDLKPNYYAKGSWDFNDQRAEPKPMLVDDRHGTRCAGEVAAARNDVCGVGIAYDSQIAGVRILSKMISDSDEAEAMVYDFQNNHIYSCSWGPPDDGRSMDAPGILIRRAMLKGIQEGRDGLGSIYVFASGNGAAKEDNCNFDGYTNSIYSVTVGAIDRTGSHPYYSEKCSAQMVVTYSSGSGDAIHTTDVGENQCYDGHGGTSAAAPIGAGVYALVLSARPDLSWRDIQWLQVMTAVPVNEDDESAEWQDTSIGKKFSHTFGYGKIDAYGIVEAAKDWEKVKPQAWYYSPWVHVNQDIPQGKDGLVAKHEVTADDLKDANLERVEHVTVTMNVNHTQRGDLSVDLISPEGVVSHIATTRKNDKAVAGYDNWTFMTVAHWGESGVGKWTVIVKDSKNNEHKGTFTDFHLKLWGEAIDADKAEKLPMPSPNDDKDHAKIQTTTQAAETTTMSHPPEASETEAPHPSDHPDRPTKVKPSQGSDDSQESPAPSGTDEASQAQASASESAPPTNTNWVSWLPSFGVSGKAQAWIYGALGLIVVFCAGLGAWLFVRRRKMGGGDTKGDYEFELLDDEEAEGLNNRADGQEKGVTGVGAGGRRSRRTRGGELYDAFAGGSDDEDEFGGAGQYHDQEPSRPSGARGERGGRRVSEDGDEDEMQHVIGDDSDDDIDEKGRR